MKVTPNHGNFILAPMISSWRFGFLQKLIRACKPSVSVDFISDALGFSSIEEGILFVRKAGAVLIPSASSAQTGAGAGTGTDAAEAGEGVGGSVVCDEFESSGLDVDTKASVNLDPTLGSDDNGLLL